MRTILNQIKLFSVILLISSSLLYSQSQLFPQLTGWKVAQEEQVYDPNNLWDIIDGAADLYLEYAFVDLHIARYYSPDSVEVKVELYRHGTAMDAFGMYSQERDPNYNFIQVGAQGYLLPEGVLNFLDGVYYIKLSTYQTGDKENSALLTVAKKLDEYLKQSNSLPIIFQLFPLAGKQQNTEQYVAQNFLGYSFLKSVATVSYKDTSIFKGFIIDTESPEKPYQLLEQYIQVISKENVKNLGKNIYEINDPHNGLVIVTIIKKYLCGIINSKDSKEMDSFLQKLNDNLSK